MITETFVLGVIGGAVGVVLAYWITGCSSRLAATAFRDATPSPSTCACSASRCCSRRRRPCSRVSYRRCNRRARSSSDYLREGAREGRGGGSRRTRNALVAAEIALSLVLLTGAGLLIRTLWSMQRAERGFQPPNVAMMTIGLPASNLRHAARRQGFFARLLERVQTQPGVVTAATGTGVLQPLVTSSGIYTIEGMPLPPPEERGRISRRDRVAGLLRDGRHDARSRTRIHRGRSRRGAASRRDQRNAARAPAGRIRIRSAVGMRLGDDTSQGALDDRRRRHSRRAPLRRDSHDSARALSIDIAGHAAHPDGAGANHWRSERDCSRRASRGSGPRSAVAVVCRHLARTRIGADDSTNRASRRSCSPSLPPSRWLLATIGIYGVTSHAVNQRTQEVGVRMAMGAVRGDVLRMMLLQHLRPGPCRCRCSASSALSCSAGSCRVCYLASAPPIRRPSPLSSRSCSRSAAVACWIPARRATRVDPLVALRTE